MLINVVLFFASTAAAGYAASEKKWGWCVVLALLAIRQAIILG